MNPQVPKGTEGPKVAHRGPQEYQMGSKVTQGGPWEPKVAQRCPNGIKGAHRGPTEPNALTLLGTYHLSVNLYESVHVNKGVCTIMNQNV